MTDFFETGGFDEPQYKSKTQVKREMEALQKLGERLTELNQEQLLQVPLSDPLLHAIHEYQRLKKNEARRRQRQFIGRLMRDEDAEAISGAIALFDASKAAHTQHFHKLEQWRERLLAKQQAVTEFLDQYPRTDAQHLRQLVRNAQREKAQDKDRGGARKLFRYLRDMTEQ